MPAKTESYDCAGCSQPFTARVSDRARGWARHCSLRCAARTQARPKGFGEPVPLPERIARFVTIESDTGCHRWTADRSHKGYAVLKVSVDGKKTNRTVHRLAYEMAKGPIPAGLHIDHLCRNRLCVNPDHLEAVTPAENTRRGLRGVLRPQTLSSDAQSVRPDGGEG